MTEACRWQRAHSKLCFLVFSCHPQSWPQAGHRKAMRLVGISVMGAVPRQECHANIPSSEIPDTMPCDAGTMCISSSRYIQRFPRRRPRDGHRRKRVQIPRTGTNPLGRVLISFDPEADAGEGDCGEEVSCKLVMAGRDASEVFELLKKRSTRLRWR